MPANRDKFLKLKALHRELKVLNRFQISEKVWDNIDFSNGGDRIFQKLESDPNTRQATARQRLDFHLSQKTRWQPLLIAAVCLTFSDLPERIWDTENLDVFVTRVREWYIAKNVLDVQPNALNSLRDLEPAGQPVELILSEIEDKTLGIGVGPSTPILQFKLGAKARVEIKTAFRKPVRIALFDIDDSGDVSVLTPSVFGDERFDSGELILMPNKHPFAFDFNSEGKSHLLAIVLPASVDVAFPEPEAGTRKIRKLRRVEFDTLSARIAGLQDADDYGVGILQYEVV
jgi:hypothetical protein